MSTVPWAFWHGVSQQQAPHHRAEREQRLLVEWQAVAFLKVLFIYECDTEHNKENAEKIFHLRLKYFFSLRSYFPDS